MASDGDFPAAGMKGIRPKKSGKEKGHGKDGIREASGAPGEGLAGLGCASQNQQRGYGGGAGVGGSPRRGSPRCPCHRGTSKGGGRWGLGSGGKGGSRGGTAPCGAGGFDAGKEIKNNKKGMKCHLSCATPPPRACHRPCPSPTAGVATSPGTLAPPWPPTPSFLVNNFFFSCVSPKKTSPPPPHAQSRIDPRSSCSGPGIPAVTAPVVTGLGAVP